MRASAKFVGAAIGMKFLGLIGAIVGGIIAIALTAMWNSWGHHIREGWNSIVNWFRRLFS